MLPCLYHVANADKSRLPDLCLILSKRKLYTPVLRSYEIEFAHNIGSDIM